MTKSVFRSVTLMLMITMIYSAVLVSFLKELTIEAEKAKAFQLEMMVPKVSDTENPCTDRFFCLAQKVLKNVSLNELTKLRRTLEQYNIKNKNGKCHLTNSTTSYNLSSLITDLYDCSVSRLSTP